MKNQKLTRQEIATIQATRATLVLNKILIVAIVAYGAYGTATNYTPITPWIFAIFAAVAYAMRPVLPDSIRKKLENTD